MAKVNARGLILIFLLLCSVWVLSAAEPAPAFPKPLADYPASLPGTSLIQVLLDRVQADPFNLIATIIFLLAIVHTFLAPHFTRLSHEYEKEHRKKLTQRGRPGSEAGNRQEVSFRVELFHFLGEVEAVFGIWTVPLLIALALDRGWPTARDYVGQTLDFTEPLFVVVIMTIASSRPILKVSEEALALVAALGKGSAAAWWFTILTLGPLLGSFITEPAGMTISALLLAKKFYSRNPSRSFAYATLGLLFVNVSVGGTLTHFAAPPVLMVAGTWGWGLSHMLTHFGWKALAGIVISNLVYFFWFAREFRILRAADSETLVPSETAADENVPAWVTMVHLGFLVWTVVTSHYPALFIGGFLFYLAFLRATEHHQNELRLRPALLVGFFLAGLVVHGGLQGWWIAPVLTSLQKTSLFLVSVVLTAFNDNAAITYLASLVPNLEAPLKYAVVAGAVTGGGLTVIANAPNPAGQSILGKFFSNGVSPLKLFLGALIPTLLIAVVFLIF